MTPLRQGAPSTGGGRTIQSARPGCARRVRAVSPGWARLLDEAGSASVLVALWSVALTMLATAAIALSSALAAREAVSSAADLAALAGASATLSEPGQACTRAATIAVVNGARLTDCRVGGSEVWVVAQVPAPRPVQWLVPGQGAHLAARAHAEWTAVDP